MPANFCLLPQFREALARKIQSGELALDDLAKRSSEERRTAFAEIVGEANAEHINAAFESKLLLKNQQKGLETWVRQQTELKPDVKRDLLARVQRMDRVLEPKDATAFLEDLAKQKLGFGVTMEEAGRIAELSKAVKDAEALPTLPNGDRPIEYGDARVAFRDYVAQLKLEASKPKTIPAKIWAGTKNVAGLSKSLVATLDNSIIGRQGINTFAIAPEIWAKNSLQTFVDMYRSFKGEDVLRAVDAEIMSRKNFPDYQRGKLAVGVHEEAFPTTLGEKIPGFRRIYKANEAAFTAWQRRTRADLFDKFKEIGEGLDVPMDKRQVTQLADIANGVTGRGNLGRAEVYADELNTFLFSARKIAADFDILTAHQFRNLADRAKGGEGLTGFSQRIAAQNTAKVLAAQVVFMAIAKALHGDTETDPRSAAFGTAENNVDSNAEALMDILLDAHGLGVNVYDGKAHIDYTGGRRGLEVLAARLLSRSTKSSRTGKVTPFYEGFNERTAGATAGDFLENKLSPTASFIWHAYTGKGRDGKPFNAVKEAVQLVTPAGIGTASDIIKERMRKP